MIFLVSPIKGSLDYDSVDDAILKVVKTKKTELLFLGLMLRMLKMGGRCAVIIPDWVLFGSSNAHKQIRQEIIENPKLDAVISMPSGVFKPYAGVSTAVLFFTKTGSGGTDHVWFYDMQADGFSLDDKRTPLITTEANKGVSPAGGGARSAGEELNPELHAKNNIPDIIARFHTLSPAGGGAQSAGEELQTPEATRLRTEQSFLVPFSEIKANDWDLSINRYKEIVYDEVKYDAPASLIADIKELDKQRADALTTLEKLLNQ